MAATLAGVALATPAWASATQAALCDLTPSCAITPDAQLARAGQYLTVDVSGTPGVAYRLQFYAIEFNASGKITGLVPSGRAVAGTSKSGKETSELVPSTVDGVPGGWGFVGLADDSSIDLTTRLGKVVEFGGRTLKLLGDGFGEQKPAGIELDMHVIGQVPSVGYWVEYRDDSGAWVALPGQGFNAPQVLRSSPGEITSILYTVPDVLTHGQPYEFRINHHLNFDGQEGRVISGAAYTTWTVIPAESGKTQARGKQFDPTARPGIADLTPTTPSAPVAQAPSAQPSAKPSAKPSTKPSSKPSGTSSPTAATTTAVLPAPSGSPSAAATPAPPASQPPASQPPAPAPSAAPAAGPVWAEETAAVAQVAAKPPSAGTQFLLWGGLALLVVATAGVALWRNPSWRASALARLAMLGLREPGARSSRTSMKSSDSSW